MTERMRPEASPEECLALGRELLRFAPERCRTCAHALQGSCEVARLALDRAINPVTAGIYLGAVIKTQCRPEFTRSSIENCSFITEPVEEGGQDETVAEVIVEHVLHVDRKLPDRVPLESVAS